MALSASCKVYIAFTDGPLVASPTWTEVTNYVRSVQTQRGRSSELEDFQAGSATIVLSNTDRRFDPDHATGPYYGNLLPRRQVKVEATYSGVTYPVYYGLAQSWQQQYPLMGRDATCTLQCADIFSLLATWDLPDTAHELVARTLAPTSFWGLDGSGSVATDRMGVSNGTYGSLREDAEALEAFGGGASRHVVTPGANTASILATFSFGPATTTSTTTTLAVIINARSLVEAYSGVVAYDCSLEALALYDTASGSGRDLRLGLTSYGEPTAVLAAVQATYTSPIVDGNTHHLCVVRSGANLTVYLDGTSVATSASASSTTTQFSYGRIGLGPFGTSTGNKDRSHDVTIDEAVVWHGTALTSGNVALLADAVDGWANERVDERITKVLDLLGVPSGLYSLQTSSMSLGPFAGGSDALSHLQNVVRGETGRLYVARDGKITFEAKTDDMGASSVATFADDTTAGSVRYSGFELELNDRLVYNDVTVTGVGGAAFSKQNATSISTYSRRALTADTQLGALTACRDVAETLTSRYASPQTRGRSWRVHPQRTLNGSTTLAWATVLGRELGDVATLKRTPPTGSAISKTVQITSIAHEIDLPAGNWTVTFTGAPVDTTASFRWGTSNWGGTDGWS